VASLLLLLVVLVFGVGGCEKLRASSDRGASADASATHETTFGALGLTVAEDVTVGERSGALTLARRPTPQNRLKPDTLDVSRLSVADYELRERNEPIKVSLAHGRLAYRIDESNISGPDITLVGEMKVDPDAHYYVTCHVSSLDGKRPPPDWCLSILRTAVHR
jgi:hypothetical protein